MTDHEAAEHDDARLGEALDRFLDDLFDGRPADIGPETGGAPETVPEPELARAHELAQRAAGAHTPHPPHFDRYEIVREVGRGGMGAVFLARRDGLEQPVALKVLPPAIALSARSRRRFLEEVRALQQLDDEHIVRIHRILDQDEILAFEMEWIDGPSLRQVLDALGSSGRSASIADLAELLGSPAPDSLAKDLPRYYARLAADIAGALTTVHASGLVHRDVKPSNILIRSDGRALLSDFGLVRDPDSSGTRTAGFVGTPVYASPEQQRAAEDPETVVDGRSDVYSLGVTLYECLTGRAPDPGSTGTPPHPTALERAIPRRLGDVVQQAIAPDPRRRYASARALERDLRRFLAGEAVMARPPGMLDRFRGIVQRHPKAVAAVALLALVVTVAALFWPGAANAGPGATRTTRFSIPTAAAQYSVFGRQIDFTPDGRRAVHWLRRGALALWDRGTSISRRIEIAEKGPWWFHSPRWSPDGGRVAMLGWRPPHIWSVFLLDPRSGEIATLRRVETDYRLQAHDLCWTPDGEGITIVTREWALYDLDANGNETRWPLTTASRRWTLGGYSPDGRWLLVSATAENEPLGESDLWVVPRGGGRSLRITALPGREHDPLFDPSGDSVWFIHSENTRSDVHRIGFDTRTGLPVGEPERVTYAEDRGIQDLSLVGDSDLIYRVSHAHQRIWVAECDALEDPRVVASGFQPVLSADGRTVYFLANESDRTGLFALDLRDGGAPVRIADRVGAPFEVHGDRAVYCAAEGDAFGVFEAAAGEPPRRLARTSGPVTPRSSPDGTRVAYIDEQTLSLVDRETGRRQELAPVVWRWQEWTVRWSPRGDALTAVAYVTPEEFPESNTVVLVTPSTGEVRRLTPAEGSVYKESVRWHPSGSFLTCVAYADTGEELRTIHVDGRASEFLWREEGHFPVVAAWSPNGRELVFQCSGACGNGMQTHAYDLDRRRVRTDVPFPEQPRWDADGDVVAWTTIRVTSHFERLHGVR